MDCIFCRIIKGEIPSDKVYEDEYLYAFRDIDAKAPVHVLVVPKTHIGSVNGLDEGNAHLAAKAFLAMKEIAAKEGISESGYRIVVNTNKDAQQSVAHIHFHMLGGRSLTWPPG